MTKSIMPDIPTAEACFAEAAANLRVAERLASYALGYDEKVNQVAYIADVWTRLGVALDNEPGFGPTPLASVEQVPIGGEHKWPSVGPTVCKRCGFGPSEVGPQCVGDLLPMNHAHTFVPESGPMCTHLGCNVLLPELTEKLMSNLRLTTPPRLEDSAPPAPPHTHKWNPFSTPDHEHTEDCGHRWVVPGEACRNGCGMSATECDHHPYCPNECPESGL